MKRYIALLTLLVSGFITFSVAPNVSADDSLLFGWKQAYSAVVRTDGKVVTYGKIYINNGSDIPLKKTSFTLPEGVEVKSLSAYQILLPKRCTSPIEPASDTVTNKEDVQSSIAPMYPDYTPTCESIEREAYELDRYSYYSYYESDTQLRYKSIDLTKNGETYNLALPKPVQPNKRGAYLVSYIATDGYTSGALGFHKLEFKTLQLPRATEEVRVSIDVSSDLYTKAGRTAIESGADSVSISSGAAAADGAIENRSLDTLQGSIGVGGTFTKTGKALNADETFVVKGEFADASWKLHIWAIIFSVGGALLLLALSIFLLKRANAPAKPKKGKKK